MKSIGGKISFFIIGLILVLYIILKFSDPQSNKFSFIVQRYFYPRDLKVLAIPANFNGDFKTWHRNGNLLEKISVKNGVKNGLRMRYYSDGTMAYIENYDNDGKYHGEFKYYYSNGQLAETVNYNHGVLHGVRIFYGEIPCYFTIQHWSDDYKKENYFIYENGLKVLSKKNQYSNDIGIAEFYDIKSLLLESKNNNINIQMR